MRPYNLRTSGRRIRARLPLVLALVLTTRVSAAQRPPAAKDILVKVSQVYARANRYEFELVTTSRISDGSGPHTDVIHVSVAVVKPDRARAHFKSDSTELLNVTDGRFKWVYMPQLKQYTKTAVARVNSDPRNSDANTPLGALSETFAQEEDMLFTPYKQLAGIADQARTVREEILSVGTKQFNCYVVELETNGRTGSPATSQHRTWWIDKTRYVVRREDTRNAVVFSKRVFERSTSTVYSVILIDPPIALDLFTFKPPYDSRQVDKFARKGS